jgi:multiple sugar transport system substrate-binding protein
MTNKYSRRTFRLRQNEMLEQLRNEILCGKIANGEYLPSEKVLAQQFGLSNKSVRTVLELLVDEQLIEKRPRIGNVVVYVLEKERITLKLGHHGTTLHEAALHELLTVFHKEYPDIQVQAITLPNNNSDVIKPYMDYGMMDVVTLNDCEFQDLVETGSEDYLTPLEKISDMYPFLSDAFTVDGQLLAQPFVFSPTILCYNRDHFIDNGLQQPDSSWSWDDVFETADKLTVDTERIGFHFSFAQRNRCALFLLQNGVIFERGAKGRVKLSGTPMLAAIRAYKELISNRMTTLLLKQDANFRTEDLFAQGKLSMIITTYLSLNNIRNSGIHYEVAPLPYQTLPVTQLIAIGLAVNKRSPQKEAAQYLVNFLTSDKAQLIIRQKTLSLPSLKTAAEWSGQVEGYRPPRYPMYREIIPSYRYHRELGLTEQEWRTFFNEVFVYWSGLESEETFCSRLEELL